MGEPLPDRPFLGWNQHELNAYDMCVQAEHTATSSADVRFAKIVGFLLIRAPNADFREHVANWVVECEQLVTVYRVGEFVQDYLIRPLYVNRAAPEASSDSPETPVEYSKEEEAAPTSPSIAKKQALIRDGHRCIVTGVWDLRAPEDVIMDISVDTKCVCIVPESISIGLSSYDAGLTERDEKLSFSNSLRTLLRCLGVDIDTFRGPVVHSLQNVMTMENNVHAVFTRLNLWFIATVRPHALSSLFYPLICGLGKDVPHRYEFGWTRRRKPPMLPLSVIFTSSRPDQLPLPSPELLALHATCAQVAQLSGAAEYFEQVDRKIEDEGVLASDGGSAEVLRHAIFARRSRPVDSCDGL